MTSTREFLLQGISLKNGHISQINGQKNNQNYKFEITSCKTKFAISNSSVLLYIAALQYLKQYLLRSLLQDSLFIFENLLLSISKNSFFIFEKPLHNCGSTPRILTNYLLYSSRVKKKNFYYITLRNCKAL